MNPVYNLQERFLLKMRKRKAPVSVFLCNGVRVDGRVTGYDQFTVVVESKGRQMQLFKSAITTISGPGNIDVFDDRPEGRSGPRSGGGGRFRRGSGRNDRRPGRPSDRRPSRDSNRPSRDSNRPPRSTDRRPSRDSNRPPDRYSGPRSNQQSTGRSDYRDRRPPHNPRGSRE